MSAVSCKEALGLLFLLSECSEKNCVNSVSEEGSAWMLSVIFFIFHAKMFIICLVTTPFLSFSDRQIHRHFARTKTFTKSLVSSSRM